MKLMCAPQPGSIRNGLAVVLYGPPVSPSQGSAGTALAAKVRRLKWMPVGRAWDFVSIALAVVAADSAGHRAQSPDGWTREFEVEVATTDPAFWDSQRKTLEEALAFLTTDRWQISFTSHGFVPPRQSQPVLPACDSVVLLSGGLDSLIGTIDLVAAGRKPIAVSQLVRGDAEHQQTFAATIGGGLLHLQLNHNAEVPDPENPPTQRARSIIFLAYGVLAATSTLAHGRGESIPLFVCENGLIALNPPLTSVRIGSLSTRTAHPRFLRGIQRVLDSAGLRVKIENPYELTTKGEMLASCKDQVLVEKLACDSTSCGRYLRYGYRHCGRCIPCQIRRAAFLYAGTTDRTNYVYRNLGKEDNDHRGFDDVRSAAMAIAEVSNRGLDAWFGASMAWASASERQRYGAMVERGLAELAALHAKYRVK